MIVEVGFLLGFRGVSNDLITFNDFGLMVGVQFERPNTISTSEFESRPPCG